MLTKQKTVVTDITTFVTTENSLSKVRCQVLLQVQQNKRHIF